jgi:hypothetical protein
MRGATAANPRSQYIVGGDAKYLLSPLLNLPTSLVEDVIFAVLYKKLVPARIHHQQQQQQQQQPQAAAAAAGPAGGAKGEEEEEVQTPIAG